MGDYAIIITPDAETDLYSIFEYIAYNLKVPDTAIRYIRDLRTGIQKLAYMPTRIEAIPREPWHHLGLRKILVKNFLVYFIINETKKTVYVLAVIYSKRNQIDVLAERYK